MKLNKAKIRRIASGFLSAVTVLSTIALPLTAFAAELPASVPTMEEVREQLDENELVTVGDLTIEYESTFDVENDFTGIEYEEENVKVSLHEAKSEEGQDFSTSHADTYKTVYYVEPVSGHPVYQVSRYITVNEPQTETSSSQETASGDTGDEESGTEEDSESDSELETGSEEKTVEMPTEQPEEPTESDNEENTSESVEDEITSETEGDVSDGDTANSETDEEVTEEPSDETGEETANSGEESETGTEDSESETEEVPETEVPETEIPEKATDSNANRSFVSGLAVKHLADGTAPFDADDEIGSDSSTENGIVRSFDYVNYTLEYTTALMDASSVVDSAYMMVEMQLNCSPSVAEFNVDTLNWCIDREITYHYADGSSSAKWDKSKEVVSQVLIGKRYLSKNGDNNAIPGTGTLSVGIYVKAAINGTILQPTFMVWMEGNDEAYYKSLIGNEITVSAAPKYNVNLTRNTNCNYLGYFDPTEGVIYEDDTVGTLYGRLEGYGLTIQLYNDSVDKGLRGIELPTGDFKFDLVVQETRNDTDVTGQPDYTPVLWDYRENMSGKVDTRGYLDRQMCTANKYTSTYATWIAPYNDGNDQEYACYEGGNFQIEQDAERGNVYHVTVRDYGFDMDNLWFPTNTCGSTRGNIAYRANVGCFSAGYVQFLVQFARAVDTTSNLYFNITAENLDVTSVSGQYTDVDRNEKDDQNSLNITLYPRGSISKRNYFYDKDGRQIASVWYAGDSYSYQNANVRIHSSFDYSGDDFITSVNILQKFDDEGLEIPAGTTDYLKYRVTNPATKIGTINTLFAAKPDKQGWESDEEMVASREENLLYFNSIDELNATGYTCVAVLYEVRDSQIYLGAGDSVALTFEMMMHVKESAEINKVYMTTNDVRAWLGEQDVLSWNAVSNGNSGAYGLGDASWEEGNYTENYVKPTYRLYTKYGKSVYENGSIAAGHSGGYIYGNSLLIIGCKTNVAISVADQTNTANGLVSKSVYDLDAGERTVTYQIEPAVLPVSENSEVTGSEDTTNVTVTARIPKGLTYIMGSATVDPIDVTVNEDGSSTVTWYFENQKVGEEMASFQLSCIIGEAGTANDVKNNDALTIEATISADKDMRTINKVHGNLSDTTIRVIRLAASSVSKTVEQPLVEEGGNITYHLRYGNSTEEDVLAVKLFDMLPFNEDGRGSAFHGGYVIDSIRVDYSNAV